MSATQFDSRSVKAMDELRLKAWYDGVLPDSALTDCEIEWLQVAVFDAIAAKKMRTDATTTSAKMLMN